MMMTNPVWLLGLDPVGGVLWLLLAPNALPARKSAMVPQVIVLLRWLSLVRHLEPKAYWRVDKAATQGPRTALTRRGYTLKVDSRTSLITARVYWPVRSQVYQPGAESATDPEAGYVKQQGLQSD